MQKKENAEQYDLDQAQEEAGRMREKIESGQAADYDQAHKKIETEARREKASKEFFYFETLDLYVATHPLKMDERIARAASEAGVNLSWDDEGRLKDISYLDAKKLAKHLGASFLSPSEYWKAYQDAEKAGDAAAMEELKSDKSTEWLDAVFEKDEDGNVYMIEHPDVSEEGDKIEYLGERKKVDMPEGRPGWFDPENNINPETGLPLSVDVKREKGTAAWTSTNWKYWSVFKINEPVSPIRGYVTSSGTPSLDLDIPVGAKQPVLMLRECRQEMLEPAMDQELMKQASGFIEKYLATTVDQPATQNPDEHEEFYKNKDEFLAFLERSGREFIDCKDKEAQKAKEKFIDILGLIRILAKEKGESREAQRVNELARGLFNVPIQETDINSIFEFSQNRGAEVEKALSEKKKIVFVMGHKNPDSDTAISSLAEAYRNSLLDQETVYVPLIQGARIPDEIRRLLGDGLADSLMLTQDSRYQAALDSGQARWILVDQNVSEVQRFAISMVDHHILSEKAKRYDISKTWEMAGSTTALVAQKFYGMGMEFDEGFGRIMYGATLMDTENRSDKKMTYKDGLVMDELKKSSGVIDDKEFYHDLMSHLLNTDDAELLFDRDYKQDWGIFGFAVAKVKGAFGSGGEVLKKDLLDNLEGLARENNAKKNFPLTIVKIADYLEDNETINRERVSMIFNQYVLPEFKQTMFEYLEEIIKNEFGGNAKIERTENSVDFWGVGDQLSRKVTAPFLEPIVEAFNKFYYSPATEQYVKREFLKVDDETKKTAAELGIELSQDPESRINNITFCEARLLLDRLGQEMMSLSEYWKVLKEAGELHDEQLVKHLRSDGFVEFLDTVILDGKYVINHPKIIKTETGYEFEGEKDEIMIPEGVPGLIYPGDIDPKTGFPAKVQSPDNYADKRLWRYWSPDAPLCIPTRGHIFLLNQPSFDTKIHPDDALANLGIRPCCKKVSPPVVEIIKNKGEVVAKISG